MKTPIAAMLLLALGATVGWAESGYDLYQKALTKERAEGKITEAIELYKRIVQKFFADRTLAAKTLVQLGRCYEKLGDAEARKAYDRVVREFADQQEPASEARARLLALSRRVGTGSEVVARRLFGGDEIEWPGSASADGRHLVYTGWSEGAQTLVLREVATGQKRWLKSTAVRANHALRAAQFSPDGKHIAYVLDRAWGRTSHLYVVPADRPDAPGAVYQDEETSVLGPLDWSPDGKLIAAVLHKQKATTSQICLIPVEGGPVRLLKTLSGGPEGPLVPPRPRFSPDGRFIAYQYPPKEGAGHADIYALAADGSGETTLVANPAKEQLVAWASDGRLIFVSDRTGIRDAWTIRVFNGKPQGEPELVRRDIGNGIPLGLSRDGSYFYQLNTGMRDVFVVTVDPATCRVLSPPTPADARYAGDNSVPDWSPDGRSLAYISRRRLKIRSVETGEEREVPVKLPFTASTLRWFPDGLAFLLGGSENDLEHHLYRVDLETGQLSRLIERPLGGDAALNPAWHPDRKTVLYKANNVPPAPPTPRKIFRLDPATGKEEIFWGDFQFGTWVLSPSGRLMAFANKEGSEDVVIIAPAAGGPARTLLRAGGPFIRKFAGLGWTADERAVLVPIATDEGRRDEVWRVPLDGGPREKLFATGMIFELRVSPDGSRIAVDAAHTGQEVWVMENFLPGARANATVAAH